MLSDFKKMKPDKRVENNRWGVLLILLIPSMAMLCYKVMIISCSITWWDILIFPGGRNNVCKSPGYEICE